MWTIRLPLVLSPGKAISVKEESFAGELGQWNCDLSLEDQRYVLNVHGFSNQDEANAFLKCLGAGLLWTSASTSTGIRFDLNPQDVTYYSDPERAARGFFRSSDPGPIHGAIDASRPAILQSDKRIVKMGAQPMTVVQSIPPDRFLSALAEGAALANVPQILENEDISLAFELFSLSQFTTSTEARFLMQMSVLESLSKQTMRPQEIQDLVDAWLAEIDARYEEAENSNDGAELKRLRTGVSRLRNESIIESIRVLVRKALQELEDPEAIDLAKRIGPLYKVRSTLTHGSGTHLGQAPAELQDIVKKTLRGVMRRPTLLNVSANSEQ